MSEDQRDTEAEETGHRPRQTDVRGPERYRVLRRPDTDRDRPLSEDQRDTEAEETRHSPRQTDVRGLERYRG